VKWSLKVANKALGWKCPAGWSAQERSVWKELLEAVGEASGLRISYDEGTLQVISPSSKHKYLTKLIERLVDRITIHRRTKVLFYGSATLKKQSEQKGAEPDACFYVQTADVVGTKELIDFNHDPPPDVVLEIDIHHESISKFPIYATFGVPELWRYDEYQFFVYRLERNLYVETPVSLSFPLLTTQLLAQLLEQSKTAGQTATLRSLREWIHHHKV